MKSVTFVGIMMCLIVMVFVGIRFRTTNVNDITPEKFVDGNLLEYDYANQYPATPDKVIELNNQIVGYMYSGKASMEEVATLIEGQRNLFSDELLSLNPVDEQVAIAQLQVEEFSRMGLKVIDFKTDGVDHDDERNDLCTVNVTQFVSNNQRNVLTYTLKRIDSRWKIHSWINVALEDLNAQ